jgi:hypothetical protein|uniref:Minor capsid protein P11 C-terminal conserved region domain-containing protein n=1 Tax=viral metagenome TaxID=1070528 RepID=A0A6C0KW94_9ZZZZ
MNTRDIVLALLIVAVGLGIFYLLDPTLGGLLKKRHEGFANNNNFNSNNNVLNEEGNSPGVNGSNGAMNNGNLNNINEANENNNANYAVNNNTGMSNNNNAEPVPNNSNNAVEGFETMTPAPMPFKDAEKPANCYPKDQINPSELLPNDPNSKWAQVNPMGQGDIAGKNYLSAGALIGVNTIGQSLRNANYQLRSDPPNPQVKVSIWQQSTIEPDINRRSLEIG